jgi:Berberine and berberine like
MQGAVHMHGDEHYNTARKVSNFAVDHRPVLIALCETAADLFWALRGGGGNFGVITSMQVRLYSIDSPLHGPIVFPWSQAESVLHRYVEFMASAPDELAVTAGVSFAPDGGPVIFISPTWSGEPRRGEQIITQLQGFGTPVVSKVAQMPYSEVLRKGDEIFANVNRFAVETRWHAAITSYAISEIIAAGNHSPSPRSIITVQSFHGTPTRIPLESTAFGLRQRHFLVLIIAAWDENTEDNGRRPREWARGLSQAIAPESLPGGYANLLAPDAYDQISWAYGSNSTRLKEIKKQLDPEGMFLSAIPLPD